MSEYEPITTELRAALDVDREFMRADGTVVAQTFCVDRNDFERCCDAIDAVHAQLESENAELRERMAVLDNERGNMHDGWVRLPLDADGEYIHAGNVLDGYGKTIEVVEMRYGRSGWVLISRDGNGYADTFAFSHHHAPTVEDVLREMHAELDEVTALYVGEAIDSDERDRDEARIFAEYAKRLTLAGDAQ